MAGAVPLPIRQALVRGHQKGDSAPALALQFHLPLRTVYHILRQARLQDGQVAAAAYHVPPIGPQAPPSLVAEALALRQAHPEWGTELIRIFLARNNPDATLPCSRTLRRWLHDAGLGPAPVGRRPAEFDPRALTVHDTWQMDAADQMALANRRLVSWLRTVDECSGAVLQTVVFPPGVQPGRRHSRPGGAARDVHDVGPARADASGQRSAVGWLE